MALSLTEGSIGTTDGSLNDIFLNLDNRIEELENMHTYSYDEQIVGTWVDGKPLYRKSFVASFETDTVNDFSHGIENVNIIWIDVGATFIYRDDDIWGANSSRQPWLAGTVQGIFVDSSAVHFQTSHPAGNLLFTLLYTKKS